jgi:hypothetical protein
MLDLKSLGKNLGDCDVGGFIQICMIEQVHGQTALSIAMSTYGEEVRHQSQKKFVTRSTCRL